MALLLSDRNRKVDHGSRVATPYKTVVLPLAACIPAYKKQIIHGMRTTVKVKCRNSQAAQKAKASMVNTIWVKIKAARESVNPCSMVEIS